MAARRKGAFELEEVIETGKTIPVDARQLVRSKEEMLDAGSFTNGYNGMFTSERTEGKIWMLMDKDNPTLEASWKVIGPYDDSALTARVAALEQAGGGGDPVDWSDVQNKPNFANVATSGSYNDLVDRPVLPAPYDDSALSGRVTALENKTETQSDWNESDSGSAAYIANKPTIPEAYDDTALAARVTALEEGGGTVTVAQTKGDSTTDVMSQKATTDMVFDDNEIVRIIPTPHQNTQLGLRDNVILGSASVGDATSTSVALGYYVNTYGSFSVGIGNNLSSGTNGGSGSCVAIGNQAMATGSQAIAIGRNASALEKNTISFGPGTPRVKGTVWFGTEAEGGFNDSNYRRIGGVYPGVGNNDVVVVEQLQRKQNTLVAGANITLTPQQDGTVEISAADGATITVDAAMSDTSENPVQNKVVFAAIGDAIDVVETAIADRYTKAETDAKIAEAMTDVDNEHFHPVTALPDPSVAKENHEYVLVTYGQDGTTIESETHYLFYDSVFHEKQTQVSLDGYATEAYVGQQLATLATVATSGSYNDLSDKPTIPEAYDDTALAGRVTAVEDGKASLQVAAIPGGGGGEEINALVSQGENSVSVSYYKDGALPNTLNLNVDSDYFSIPTTGYADEKAAQAQSNAQTYADLKLTQKQDKLVSGQNIKSVNGSSLLGNGDLLIREGVVVIDVTSPPTMTEIEDYIERTGAIVKNGEEYYTAYTYSRDDEAETFIIVCLGAVEGILGSKFFWFNQTGNDSIVFDHVSNAPSTKFGTAYRNDTLYYASVRKTATDQMLFAVYNSTPDLLDVNFYCEDQRGGTGNIQVPTKEYVDGKSGINIKVGEERWQGTYTDENNETFQVYSKMVYIPALPATAGITTYDHGVANIKQILNIYGFTTDGFVLNAPRQNAQDNIAIYQASKSASNQTFSIEVGKDRSNKAAYVVMVYAKNN